MNTVATDSPFTEAQRRTMIAIAGAIIPASEEYGVPGADDPAIAADIIATAARHREPVAAALALHDRLADVIYGTSFADLDSDVKTELVEGSQRPGYFEDLGQDEAAQIAAQRALTSIVVQCYYRDDRVMKSLGMDARPPFPQGFEVDESDWSLLEPVKQRGRIYRDAGGQR